MTEYSKVVMAYALILLFSLLSPLYGGPIVIEDIIQVQETCELDNGMITILVAGNTAGLEYSIDGGLTYSTSNHFENLDSKDYTIIVTRGNTCTELYTAQIADAGFPELELKSRCVPGLNRSIVEPLVTGGSKPYQFEWRGPDGNTYSSEILPEARPGTYYVSVTDNLGCFFSDSISVSECCSLNLSCDLDDQDFDCINTIPDWDQALSNPLTPELTRNELLEDIGISIEAGACGPITVQVIDTDNNPTDCSNSTLVVNRDYIITDAHTEVICSQSYSISNFLTASTLAEAEDMSLTCSPDLQASFESWLDNYGGFDFQACSDPVTISTIPANPILDSDCGSENKVTFVVEDGCGNTIESTASFIVEVDAVEPLIDCPEKLIIPTSAIDPISLVEAWLKETTLSDNCTDSPILADNFNADLSNLCSIDQPIEVEFVATDDCENTSACTSTIEIINTRPELTCPADLTIDCGSGDVADILSQWTTDATAVQNDGNIIANDLSDDMSNIVCSEIYPVVFSTINDCGLEAECATTVTLRDDQKPEITCPEAIEIDVLEGSAASSINSWLERAVATDCNTWTLTNDFDTDLSEVRCSDTYPVTFTAEDFCGLTNSCSSMIIVINEGGIEITCPEAITLLCSDPNLSYEIENHINQITVTADDSYEVSNDYDESLIDLECSSTTNLDVGIYAIDYCGKEVDCRTAIDIIPDPEIYIPNVFSPDGDGLEDYFTAYGNTSVVMIKSMTIYTRWGTKVFEKNNFLPNDAQIGWDGYYREQQERTEVFTYYILLEDTLGSEMEKVGTVQILKK